MSDNTTEIEQQAPTGPRTLGEAVAAVTEHCLRTELRRLKALQERSNRRVSVDRDTLDAMAERLRQFATLQRLLDRGPLVLIGFDAATPHTVRECSAPWLNGDAARTAWALLPLPQWFVATDAARVRQALQTTDDEVTLTVELERGANSQRHLLQLLPLDPEQPDLRWACLLRLAPQPAKFADRASRRTPPRPTVSPRAQSLPPQSR
jgi:hypothetical protein